MLRSSLTLAALLACAAPAAAQARVDFSALQRDYDARRAAYVDLLARSTNLHGQIARLERRLPLSSSAGALLAAAQLEQRRDKAQFRAISLLRLLYLHPGALPAAATASAVRRGGWKGMGGGLRRGRAVIDPRLHAARKIGLQEPSR